jgi:hypothetical protein
MQTTREPLLLRRMKSGIVKGHGHAYKFYLNHILFDDAFNYGNGENFEIMLGQRLHSV